MKQAITRWYSHQSKEMFIFWLTVILAIITGYAVAYYFNQPISKWMANMESIQDSLAFWLRFGVTAAIVLFIGGFINGRMSK